ncbi:hypothetical protein QZH41_011425 [Actinostola sp. cb2023]|nr:hypothetical protein QZH41_011425 [Actinostola sp. cb2023]
MAEITEDGSFNKTSRHRRDRTERSNRRLRENTGDSPAAITDVNTSNQADSSEVNEQLLSPASAEREVTPRKDKRRSKRDELEVNTTEEASSESTPSGDTPTRTRIKKEKKSENTARKRREKKNLREKRRSTGVVIMPTGESDDEENEEKKALKQHTQQNEQLVPNKDDNEDLLVVVRMIPNPLLYKSFSVLNASQDFVKNSISHNLYDYDVDDAKGVPNIRIDDKVINDSESIEKQKLSEKVEEYELQIDDFKSKLERANKELEQLRLDNQRLKDENSALLRVVNQLSTKKK